MTLPAILIGTGSVRGVICVFPEKPTILMDELERGSPRPSFPMQEYDAPVSTMKGCCCLYISTGIVGSSCGCDEMAGAITSSLGSSGPPYCQLAAGPVHGLVGQAARVWPDCPHPQHPYGSLLFLHCCCSPGPPLGGPRGLDAPLPLGAALPLPGFGRKKGGPPGTWLQY